MIPETNRGTKMNKLLVNNITKHCANNFHLVLNKNEPNRFINLANVSMKLKTFLDPQYQGKE
jgi:hypothetical protein